VSPVDLGAAAGVEPISSNDQRPLSVGLADFFAAQKDAPDPVPLIEGILSADGSGWIAGEEKLGKTPYALEEAVCLAIGADVCGRFKVPERQRVLFFCEEDTARRAYKRLRALIRGKGLDPEDPRLELNDCFRLAVWSGIKLDDPLMLARVDAEHHAFRPAVTYYDSLRKIQRLDLNKTHQAEAFLDALDGLRRKYGTLARIIAHNRKVAAGGFRTGRGSQEIAGSHVLGAWGECSIFLEPIGRKAGAVRLTVQCKDWAPMDPFRLVIESTGPAETPKTMTLRVEDDRGDDAEDRVLDAIATLPPVAPLTGSPGVPKAAIATLLKCSERTVQRALTKLEGSGRISVMGHLSKGRPLYGVSGQ
jgi:AAA domain